MEQVLTSESTGAHLHYSIRYSSLRLVPTIARQHAPSQYVAVHPRRCEVDMLQQAAVERTED